MVHNELHAIDLAIIAAYLIAMVLVEFGCTGNTLAEALRSADYLAQALCAFWDMIEFSEDF